MKKSKIRTVMHEFKTGSLKSSSGQKVTNPKQGIAIALSEARRSNKGGEMRIKRGTPKKMALGGKAEIAKKAAAAGVRAALRPVPVPPRPILRPVPVPLPVHAGAKPPKPLVSKPMISKPLSPQRAVPPLRATMKKGGATSRIPLSKKQRDLIPGPKMSAGGYTKAADGVAKRGLTKGKMLRKGGKVI
jgi:hypothetical protein